MPQRHIFCAAHRCGKTRWLAMSASAALQAGTSAKHILALTVHQPAANVLREILQQTTDQPIPTTTLRQRAMHLLEATPEAVRLPTGWQSSALLSGIDRRLLIRQAWMAAGAGDHTLLARRGGQPGALDWVARLFDQLSEWCGTADPHALPALHITDPELAELWRAYRVYLELCQQHGLLAFAEVFNRAIDLLRHSPSATPPLLLLDDLDLCRPDELLFLAALITPTTEVYAAAARPPEQSAAVACERYLAQWAVRRGFTIEAATATSSPPAMTRGEYATPDAEVHAIARQIAAHELTERGDVDAFAIVAFAPELVPLLQRILPQYGLPVVGQDGRDGYTLALAPLALAGIKLLAAQPLTPAETIALLRHPALGLSHIDSHSAVELVQQRRWQPFAADPPAGSELSAAGRARLHEIETVTAGLRAAPLPPSVALRRWLAALDFDTRAWQQSEQTLPAWAVAVDRAHWTRWLGFVEQAEALRATLGATLTIEDALDVLIAAQALIEREGQPHERAVAIWSPTMLGGCTAEIVFCAGLHEGALPLPLTPLPLTNDDELLAQAFGALPGFVAPQLHDRAAAWARGIHDLRRAVGRAQAAVHLSYSRTDPQERRRLPSALLAATAGAQIDRDGRLSVSADQSISETQPSSISQPPPSSDLLIQAQAAPLPDLAASESPFQVSPSMIEDYFTCPRRCYYARRLDLYDVASSPRQALGMVVHGALDDLLRRASAADDAEQLAAQLVAHHWIEDEQRWGSRLKQTIFRQLAETAVAHVARAEQTTAGQRTFLGGELGFRWTPAGTDLLVYGRIDRIDRAADGLHVIDYKLGQHSPSINALLREFVRPRDPAEAAAWRPGDIQLPLYALAVEQGLVEGIERAPDERVARVTLVYPLELYSETGKVSARGRREIELIDHAPGCLACESAPQSRPKVGTLCRAQLAAVEQEVCAAVAQMRAGDWAARPREGGRTCTGCVFRPICSDPQ